MPIFSPTIQELASNKMPQPYYRFGGSSDKIVTNNPIITGTGDFSFIAWIYKETSTTTDYICGNYGTGNLGGVEFYTVSGGRLTVHNTSSILSTGTIGNGVWTHVGLTRISGAIQLYINGVADGAGTLADTIDGDENFAIGNGPDYTSEDFNGSISDVKVFNKGLSATEVKELYSGASVPFKYKGANQTELVTNGDFASDSGWTLATNASIGSGTLEHDGVANNNYTYRNDSSITAGRRYRVTFTVSSYSAGECRWTFGAGSQVGSARTADGTYTEEVTSTVTSTRVGIFNGNTGGYNVDDFSIVRIGAVAEYDGSGIASDKWFDKSGNDYHGSVVGATVENAPSGDDGLVYEEGTWTPDFYGSTGGSHTYSGEGRYTRIGNQVTCRFDKASFTWTTGFSGGLYVRGLPFTGEANANHLSCATDAYYYPASTWQSTDECGILFLKNSADASLYCRIRDVGGDSDTAFPASRLNGEANQFFGFMFTYHV